MNNENLKPIKLIATYYRVSTTTQEENQTIQTQIHAVKDYALKSNYKIVQEYADDGWSGDALARPALDQLRVDARKKIWDAVLVYDPDRIARRYSYQELVMDELKEIGVPVLFVTVPEAKNDEDKIMYGMRGLFAQYERVKIAERFRLGKLRKAKSNHVIVSEAPYGYNFITRKGNPGDADFKQGYYEINESESVVVRNLFSWVVHERLTIRQLVKRLQDQGIKPRKSTRGVWSTSTLSTLLRNKSYIGEAHYGASYAVVPLNPIKKIGYKRIKKTSRKFKPESEWIKISCPSIIDKSIFERANAQLDENLTFCKRNKKNEYLLGGKIWCTCGSRRTGEGVLQGKHLYYRCSNRTNSFPLASTCALKSVNAREADQKVWNKLSDLMSSPELLCKQIERWLNSQAKQKLGPTIDIESSKNNISKFRDQEDRYIKAYGSGALTLEELKEYFKPLKEKISLLEEQINKVQRYSIEENTPLLPTKEDIVSFAKKATLTLKNLSFTSKQEIVRNIIEKIVGNREELTVYGNIPVNNYVEYKSSHRHRRSPKRW